MGSPAPGDPTLCVYCAQWSVFDAALELRRPTSEELCELERVPLYVEVRRRVQMGLVMRIFEGNGGL